MTDSERLIRVINESGMTAKDFAAKIEVGQGTISNIAGGRNKPSLDVMQRVLIQFPNIRPEWLILGVDPMYRDENDLKPVGAEPNLFNTTTGEADSASPVDDQPHADRVVEKIVERVVTKTIDKIVIFYSDGTFEER